MLHGEALRTELRRICSIEYVMPPPPPPPEPKPEPVKKDYERKIITPERRAKMLGHAKSRSARSIAARPLGCMHLEEVRVRAGCSREAVKSRIKRAGVKPVKRDAFGWYSIADLERAGIV